VLRELFVNLLLVRVDLPVDFSKPPHIVVNVAIERADDLIELAVDLSEHPVKVVTHLRLFSLL
jgi:hypothetical protein